MAIISVQEQHILIDQALQRFSAFAYADVDHAEIDIQLNRAQYKVIDECINISPNDREVEGLEKNTQMLSILRPLVTRSNEIAWSASGIDLPEDLYHIIKVRCEVAKDCPSPSYKYEKVRIGLTEEEDELIDHPFAKSDVKSLLGFVRGSKLYVEVPTGTLLRNILIDYIKKPQQIKFAIDQNGNFDSGNSINCSLEGDGAYKVTDYAISYISKIIDSAPNKVNYFDNEKVN